MYVQYNMHYHARGETGGGGEEKKLFNCSISNSAYVK